MLSLKPLEENYFRASIKIPLDSTPNHLLAHLINQVQVHSFIESIPSMNDIFIKSVTGEISDTKPVLSV
jgi:ABC-2 type transport system ATP-binding protein